MKKLMILLLLCFFGVSPVSADTVKDNSIHFDTNRIESDQNQNTGQQSDLVSGLFDKETNDLIEKSKKEKRKQEDKQNGSLFTKETISSQETVRKDLFLNQEETVSKYILAEPFQTNTSLTNSFIYLGLIILILGIATILTMKLREKDEEHTH